MSQPYISLFNRIALILLVAIFATTAIPRSTHADTKDIKPGPLSNEELKERLKLFAPVEITYDESVLSEPEKAALNKLVQAARIMDEIFSRQVWSGNPDMKKMLKTMLDKVNEPGVAKEEAEYIRNLWHFYSINIGPWDRINGHEIFFGSTTKPKGAGYYPEDMTKEEFETHIKQHPEDTDAFQGYFTMIERDNGLLKAVPYNEAFSIYLKKAAERQYEAADILTDPANVSKLPPGVDYTTFATFLKSRADAYLSNDYFQSDMDWMDVTDNILDATIGPYEVYEDELFGYKAAFEAFIAIRHPADSKELDGLKGYLQAMENNLPIPDEYKNPNRGSESPISVVDVVYGGGETKAGVQTIAFNLPNDERVREAKGSKKVMLKNISRAKYDTILMPIAEMILDPAQIGKIDFETYFSNTLMHEFAHALGPGNITLPDGKETTVNLALADLYSGIEEAKADICGLYNTGFLVEQGFFPKEQEEKSYITFLPGFFRAIRFGIHKAHGKANMIQFNYMSEKGAVVYDNATEKFSVDLAKIPGAVKSLANELLMIQAKGIMKRRRR
ncbi:MAG: peptidase [Candidatus Latescibacterota bacterium]